MAWHTKVLTIPAAGILQLFDNQQQIGRTRKKLVIHNGRAYADDLYIIYADGLSMALFSSDNKSAGVFQLPPGETFIDEGADCYQGTVILAATAGNAYRCNELVY